MAFDNTLMAKSASNFTTNIYWTYGPSADTLATITASAYFDSFANQITKNNMLYIIGSDGTDLREFSNTTGVTPVTTEAFITAGDLADNSVTTPKIADLAVTTAKIALLNVTEGTIAAGAVTEPKVSPNSLSGTVVNNVADNAVIGGIPVFYSILTPGGATADTDVIVTHKIKIIDVLVINATIGTASDTVRVQNGAGFITDVMDVSGADETITRPTLLDDANFIINASGTLRIAQTDGGGSDSPALIVHVMAVRVA